MAELGLMRAGRAPVPSELPVLTPKQPLSRARIL